MTKSGHFPTPTEVVRDSSEFRVSVKEVGSVPTGADGTLKNPRFGRVPLLWRTRCEFRIFRLRPHCPFGVFQVMVR